MAKKNSISKIMLSALLALPCMNAEAQQTVTPFATQGPRKTAVISNLYDYTRQIPQKEQYYTWVNEDWELQNDLKYEYNDLYQYKNIYETKYVDGYIGEYKHHSYEYDSQQRVTKYLTRYRYSSQDPWTNETMSSYTYDDVVNDLMIKEEVLAWNDMWEDWESSYSGYEMDILRDNNNRIVSRIIYNPTRSYAYSAWYYEYADETGPAVKVRVEEMNDYYDLVPTRLYTNMVWEKSNCQYVDDDNSLYFSFCNDPENIVRSMTVYTYDEYENPIYNADIENVWDEKGRKLQAAIYSADGVNILNRYSFDIRDNGGYDYNYYVWQDADDNHKYDEGEEILNNMAYVTHHHFDAQGNRILEESLMYNETTKAFDTDNYKYSYDFTYLEDGTTQEVVKTYSKKGKETKRERWTYGDFIKPVPTAIKGIENNVKDLKAGVAYSVYDINGTLVRQGTVSSADALLESLPGGVYVVRTDGGTFKMVR